MELHNIKSAYGLAETLYGVTPSESQFEDMALNAWELIGTKHTRLHRYVGNTVNKILQLPCNADLIESVHLPIMDAQISTPTDDFNHDAVYIEHDIEFDHKLKDPYYQAGKYLKYWYTVRQRIATNSILIIVATLVYFDFKKVDKRSRNLITSPRDLVYPQKSILFT